MHGAEVLLELGGVILGLGILGRLGGRLGLSAIPLYLLAGLAFGEGGLLPLVTAQEFIEATQVGNEMAALLPLGGWELPICDKWARTLHGRCLEKRPASMVTA